ncbi:segregation and condensation protein A [Limibacillus halophilus]|jgi:segregation and condensation protein A
MNEDHDKAGDAFEEDEEGANPFGEALRLDLEGFEGPIHVLLELARDQKVDILQISMTQLADQYLDFIRKAKELRLELAADYLVMAAWLAYLKSRLLLPSQKEEEEEPSATAMAAALRFQLQRLEAMQRLGKQLVERPRLGSEIFARGMPEAMKTVQTVTYEVSLFELLRGYTRHHARVKATSLQVQAFDLYSVEDAIQRLTKFLGNLPDWSDLFSFLPSDLKDDLLIRSAMASTFAATLELAKSGKVELRQDGAFRPLYLRSRSEES